MAGKNQRSATLPSSLRHGIQQTEESEGFFTKLKKKFRLKKGRYHVDVNTGECQNIAPVSFKKRESQEPLDDESPWQLRDPKSEERDLKTHSPKLSKQSISKQTDKHAIGSKGKERKLSNPETYTRSLNSSELNSFQRSSFGAKLKSTNEYSPLSYDTKDNVAERSQKLRESALKNDFVIHDDSAIELETDVEKIDKVSSEADEIANSDIGFDPGYEKLPERRGVNKVNKMSEVLKADFDPNYESVHEVRKKDRSEFDPNYESVDDVKTRISKLKDKDDSFLFEEDPGYQSVKDVKRETPKRSTDELIRPPKTYSMNQSIESLDEPGYESLNDVKKRIREQNLEKLSYETVTDDRTGSKPAEIQQSVSEGEEFNDSAIGSVPESECLHQNDLSKSRHFSGNGSIATSDSNGVLRAFAETAVSLTGIATALTGSGTSKDSGFESKERSLDLEQEENLYSRVKKPGIDDSDNPYSMVNKDKKQSDDARPVQTTPASEKTENSGATETLSEPGLDGYDSDTGVMLDPGYAECADAIKGIIPYSVYSEGSGSKMSSCTSLDLSAEDFAIEPGYAECADAIKSGAIKKISVSHERLVDHATGTRNEEHKSKGEISSEIYANPQILFRKRSKLIEDGNLEDVSETNEKTEAGKDKLSQSEEEICLAVENKSKKKENKAMTTKQEKAAPLEAPPLPARNYSLYLDNEEAEEVVQEVLQDCKKDENFDGSSLDEAFEIVESVSLHSETAFEKPDKEIDIGRTNETAEKQTNEIDKDNAAAKKQTAVIVAEQAETVLKCEGSSCADVGQRESEHFPSIRIDTVETNTDTCNSDSTDVCSTCIADESVKVIQESDGSQTKCFELEKKNRLDINISENSQKTDKENECEEACKDNSAKCTGTDTLFQTDNCDFSRKSDIACCVVTDNWTQDVSAAKNDAEKILEVNVKDEEGNVKILKVVEKQESFKLQKKRENSRKRAGNCQEVESVENKESQVCDECDNLATHNDRNKDLSQTKDIRGSDSSHPNSTNVYETKETTDLLNQESCSNCNVLRDSEGRSTSETDTTAIHEPWLMQTGGISKLKNKDTVSGNINAYQTNTSSYKNGLSGADSSNFLTVAVKMKTISVDSDSDLFNTEDLPKLEISESDLESPFDSSDNSNTGNLDIETESAGIDKLIQRLKTEDIPEVVSNETKCRIDLDLIKDESNETCLECVTNQTSKGCETDGDAGPSNNITGKDTSIKDAQSIEIEGKIIQLDKEPQSELCSNNASVIKNDNTLKDTYQIHDEVFKDMCDRKSNDRKATLESRLCVIESEREGESDLTQLMGSCSVGAIADIDSVDNELSDDSAIGNVNDLQQNNDYLHSDINSAETSCKIDENEKDNENMQNEINRSDTSVSSQQLHLIYEKEHPSLYEDSEPTHMSLQEVLGLSPAHEHGTVSQSDNSEQKLPSAVSPNTFVHANIPNVDQESTITPPPRPPPVANNQSRSRISVPDQSSQGAPVTPTDEFPPPTRLSYSGGQSDEGSPPAVPPRSATATKRPASYSQDFMESMRQLKDCGWYWGPLSWEEAEHKLAKKPEGTFLVRDSSDEHYILSLSFKNQGRVHHTRIEHHKGHFSFWSQPDSHGKSTIKEFIEQCVENSRNGRFLYFIRPSGPGSPPMPIQLLHPVSRFIQMRSLQHMCRFRILQLVRRDHIDHLPIPTRIKQYLKEAQYYVEYLDD